MDPDIRKSFATVERRFQSIDRRFEQVDSRFEQVDGRFEQIDHRFEQIDRRFENIDRRFEQMDGRFEQVDRRFENIDGRFKNLEDLIVGLHDSLKAEMTQFADRIDAAVRRHSGIIASGSVAIASLNNWAKRSDELDNRRDADIRDLRARVRKIEAAMRRKKPR